MSAVPTDDPLGDGADRGKAAPIMTPDSPASGPDMPGGAPMDEEKAPSRTTRRTKKRRTVRRFKIHQQDWSRFLIVSILVGIAVGTALFILSKVR